MIAKRLFQFVRAMLIIRRVEFRIAEIPILGIAVALSAKDSTFLSSGFFWEGVVLFFVLFAFGDMINVLADRELDSKYKVSLSNAVYSLGVSFVAFQVVAYAVIAIGLSIHLAFIYDRPIIVGLVLVGLLFGSQYSVKPLHLKSQGIWQLICLWAIIFIGPMLLASTLVRDVPSLSLLLVALAYGALQMGIILINTAEDYPEDLDAGIDNTIVHLGLPKGIALAAGIVAIAGVVYVAEVVALSASAGLSAGWYGAVGLLVISWIVILARLVELSREVKHLPLSEAIFLVKKRAKFVPVALTFTAWPSLVWAIGILNS